MINAGLVEYVGSRQPVSATSGCASFNSGSHVLRPPAQGERYREQRGKAAMFTILALGPKGATTWFIGARTAPQPSFNGAMSTRPTRYWASRPLCHTLHKLEIGRLVGGWVTTSESLLSYVFVFSPSRVMPAGCNDIYIYIAYEPYQSPYLGGSLGRWRKLDLPLGTLSKLVLYHYCKSYSLSEPLHAADSANLLYLEATNCGEMFDTPQEHKEHPD